MNLLFWKKKPSKNITAEPSPEAEQEQAGFNMESVTLEDFQRMVKYGKSSDTIGIYKSKPFIELPYGVIKKDLPLYQQKELVFETVELILGCQYEKLNLSKASGNEILQFLIWIKEQQEFIMNREAEHLTSEPEPEMAAAGVDRLNIHGEILTIDSLAQRDILKHELIEKMPYYKVFKKLLIDKEIRDFEKRYAKIMEQKHKKN